MKMIWTSVLLCACSVSIFSQALHTKSQELIDTTSTVLCKCFNIAFDSLDTEVKTLVQQVLVNPELGQQKIQDHLLQVGEEKAAKVIQQLQELGSIDSDLTDCFDKATFIFQHFPCGLEELTVDDQLIVMKDFESEEKTIDLLMRSLSVRKECEFAYHFIELGLELKKK